MKTLILATVLFVTSLVSAQTPYEQGMDKALGLWKENKATEASAVFERIAAVETTNWLPAYYVALVNVTESFNPKNKENASALINKAQSFLDKATAISQDNPELLIMQAMINTALIVQDPMTNGMKLSQPTLELYDTAQKLDPNNPRAVFCKAEFEIGGAKFWGTDTTPMCEQVQKSITLFANEKPTVKYAPSWGKERAEATLLSCAKK